jgi:aldehyde dehydrogenase (NAD+)
VLDDADLAAACGFAAFSGIMHAGQGCALTTRIVLPRDRYDEGVELMAATMSAIGAGDPADPGTICGPLISARQRERVEGYLRSALDEGGSFACGGKRSDRDRGFFIDPTLVVGLDNTATIAQEEVFGPVLVAIPHDGDDDAVRIANESDYGLSGAVFGTDLDRANAVAGRMRTGTVGVNGGLWYAADVPFGGYKQSGLGREMGVQGFEEYLETKVIAQPA